MHWGSCPSYFSGWFGKQAHYFAICTHIGVPEAVLTYLFVQTNFQTQNLLCIGFVLSLELPPPLG